jgi:hypothetical protein
MSLTWARAILGEVKAEVGRWRDLAGDAIDGTLEVLPTAAIAAPLARESQSGRSN